MYFTEHRKKFCCEIRFRGRDGVISAPSNGVTRGVRGAGRLPGSPHLARQTIIRTCKKISF